jgi:hypothetical protein
VADVSWMQAPAIIRKRIAFPSKLQYSRQLIVSLIGTWLIGIDVGHWVSFFSYGDMILLQEMQLQRMAFIIEIRTL